VGAGDVPPGPAGGTGRAAGEPYTRQLAGKLRELRFYCGAERIRITYWIAPGRRIIMLTVFAKAKMRETAEIARGQAGDGPLPAGSPHPRRGRGGMTMSDHMGKRTSLADARAARIHRPRVAEAYEAARLRFELAEAVRLRREELGWSQRQLAERAGMSQPGVARFEAGGTTPTLPLLERLADALGLTLTVSLTPQQRRSA
jgi:HTH-type transcriptional regulator / antitoxin HipB